MIHVSLIRSFVVVAHPFQSVCKFVAAWSILILGDHEHRWNKRIFLLLSPGQPAVPLFVAPSVTPWRYKLKTGEIGPPHNPAVRLVSFDRTSGKHLNIQQYRLDLPQGNLQRKANFTLLYNFTQVGRPPWYHRVCLVSYLCTETSSAQYTVYWNLFSQRFFCPSSVAHVSFFFLKR